MALTSFGSLPLRARSFSACACPKIWHAILAYNDEGLWIAPSGQTSSPEPLYLVAPGGRTRAPSSISSTKGSRSGSSGPATPFG